MKGEIKAVLKGGKRRQTKPSKFGFESEPKTRDRSEFRGIGRKKKKRGLRGKAEVFSMMNFGIVEDENVKGIGMVSGKGIQKGLKRSQIELEGGFKIGFARSRGDNAKEIKRLKAVLV